MKLAYMGAGYCGWQKQTRISHIPSVQGTVEQALARITNQSSVRIVGSGRTDSGVNASGQVAHFRISLEFKNWPAEKLIAGLNSALPQDIRILALREVHDEFHAQKMAEKKQYSYYFQQGPVPLPHLRSSSWWIRKPLDLKAIQIALENLIGEHDFKAFQASGAKIGPTTRKIFEAELIKIRNPFPYHNFVDCNLIQIRIVGNGFLKQMVRGIAGTLLQVGESKREPTCVRTIIERKDRALVGPTAPAKALWLERVWYPIDF